MNDTQPDVLTINGGSSSIRFAGYRAGDPPRRLWHGKLDRIGQSQPTIAFSVPGGAEQREAAAAATDRSAAARALVDWLERRAGTASIAAVGHRIVHGMARAAPERVTDALLSDLRRIVPYDPEHLPLEIELIEVLAARHPAWVQVACFDTAFHRTMPAVARLFPLPRRFLAAGIERYGFHGLSYEHVRAELARLDRAASAGRVVAAHLGNGASLAAMRAGRCVDTSMGFTPTGGVPMGTRSGDLDPGVVLSLMRTQGLSLDAMDALLNRESGLRGVSETTSDVRDLLERESADPRAAEALELFCYQVRKWIGAYAAAMGGIDAIVFTGGIGENAGSIRARICRDLGFLGIALDAASNADNASVISSVASRVTVRVVRADEEMTIARAVCRMLDAGAVGRTEQEETS